MTTPASDSCCAVSAHRPTLTAVRNPELHTPVRSLRMDDGTWRELGDVVGTRNRSAVINELVRWYLRKPGAKAPKRPER